MIYVISVSESEQNISFMSGPTRFPSSCYIKLLAAPLGIVIIPLRFHDEAKTECLVF